MNKMFAQIRDYAKTVATGTVQSYAGNITALVSDAKETATMIGADFKQHKDQWDESRRSFGRQKIMEWFNLKEVETEPSDKDDDYDAGFQIGSEDTDEPAKEDSSKLDVDSMKEISKGQQHAIYSVGKQQTATSIANTAETISVINGRTSELLTAINNIGKNVETISKNLEGIKGFMEGKAQAEGESSVGAANQSELYDSQGRLTIKGVTSAIVPAIKELPGVAEISSLVDMIRGGEKQTLGQRLGELTSAKLTDKILSSIKIDDKSLKDITTQFNNVVGEVSQNILEGIVSLPLFERFRKSKANTDYGAIDEKRYSKEVATFDKKTQFTITNVIPEYLKSINKALTGITLNVDGMGNVTDRDLSKDFSARVVWNASNRSGLGSSVGESIASEWKNKKIGNKVFDEKDVETAEMCLMQAIDSWMEETHEQFINGERLNSKEIRTRAQTFLAFATSWDSAYCAELMNSIISKACLDYKYMQTIKANAIENRRNVHMAGTNYDGPGASSITDDMRKSVLKAAFSGLSANEYMEQKNSVSTNSVLNNTSSQINPGSIKEIVPKNTMDAVNNIYALLNRGIAVKVVDSISPLGGAGGTSSVSGKSSRVSATTAVSDASSGGTATSGTTASATGTSASASGTTTAQQPTLIGTATQIDQATWTAASNTIGKYLTPEAKEKFNNFNSKIDERYQTAVSENATRVNTQLAEQIAEGSKNYKFEQGVSQEDQVAAQAALSALQAAMTSNDVDESEQQAINEAIDRIQNKRLRENIKSTSERFMKKKVSAKADVSKSPLLKILGIGWIAVKKALSPVVAIIKSGFSMIGKIGKFLLKPIGGYFKAVLKLGLSGAGDIGRGFKNIFQSIWGRDAKLDEDGNVLEHGLHGIRDIFAKIGDAISNRDKKEKSKPDKEKSSSSSDNEEEEKVGIFKRIGNAYSNAKWSLADKMKSGSGPLGDFGKGFSEAFFGYRKDKEEKANASALADDRKKNPLQSQLLDIQLGKNENSIFGKIFKKVEEIVEIEKKSNGIDDDKKPSGSSESSESSKSESSDSKAKKSGKNVMGILGNIGAHLGGLASIGKGLLKMFASAVLALSGFKALTKLVGTIFTEGVKPLNKAFKAITKALKPVVKSLTGTVKVIAGILSDVVVDTLEIISPIIQAIGPTVERLVSALPLDLIASFFTQMAESGFMKVTLNLIATVLKQIANVVDIISGVIKAVYGAIRSIGGLLLSALGDIVSIVAPETGKEWIDKGDSMTKEGVTFIGAGIDQIGRGFQNAFQTTVGFFKDVDGSESAVAEEEPTTVTRRTTNTNDNTWNGSTLDGSVAGVYGNGDYRSQSNYGGMYGMTQHGCGPVALADAYNRRMGSRMDASNLAAAMMGSGTYSSSNGTSVGGFMSAGRSLGMNMTAGGVSAGSLRYASPTNPITIVGSGSDFGTRNGNVHYMNVVGTARDGAALVANPLTGNIERHSRASLAANSILGLYGHGDFLDAAKEKASDLNVDVRSGLISGGTSIGNSIGSKIGEAINATDNGFVNGAKEIGAGILNGGLVTGGALAGSKAAEVITNAIKGESSDETKVTSADRIAKYGSIGEDSDSPFGSGFKSAIDKLKDIGSKIINLFSFEDEDEEKAQTDREVKLNELRTQIGEELFNRFEKRAREEFDEDYPKGTMSDAKREQLWNQQRYDRIKDITVEEYEKDSLEFEKGLTTLDEEGNKVSIVDFMRDNIESDKSYAPSHSAGGILSTFLQQLINNTTQASAGAAGGMTANFTPILTADDMYKNIGDASHKNPYFNSKSNGGYSGGLAGSSLKHSIPYANILHNCVGWASGRFNQISDKGKFEYYLTPPNAGLFVERGKESGLETGTEPKPGAILSWKRPGEAGHVAFVEKVNEDGSIVTSESGYSSTKLWTKSRKNDDGNWNQSKAYNFSGFIYNPNVKMTSGTMVGDTRTEQFYSYLVSSGFSPIGAAGLVGNFLHEAGSSLATNTLEIPFRQKWGTTNDKFTSDVDSGKISRDYFINHTERYGDVYPKGTAKSKNAQQPYGYGLPQFTSSDLKAGIYDLAKERSVSISDPTVQLDSILAVLKTYNPKGVGNLYDAINNARSTDYSADLFLDYYERPANKESERPGRRASARDVYASFGSKDYAGMVGTWDASSSGYDSSLDNMYDGPVEDRDTASTAASVISYDAGSAAKNMAGFTTMINNLTGGKIINKNGASYLTDGGLYSYIMNGYDGSQTIKSWQRTNPNEWGAMQKVALEKNKLMRSSDWFSKQIGKNIDRGHFKYNGKDHSMLRWDNSFKTYADWAKKYPDYSTALLDQIFGSGDTMIGDGQIGMFDIPAIDEFKLTQIAQQQSPIMNIPQQQRSYNTPTVVNAKQIGSSEDYYDKLMHATFEVKSASIEAILNRISNQIDNMRTQKQKTPTPKNAPSQMFENDVPASVTRMAIG